ncbi:MAG TPA: twin-arginine translocase TatA/TatE family subunit [Steroidobacteraceae bacterium]|nr:twin-arginine translocase TatA/TatE family subunit [Steroidobacteraceae bacterium]
MGMPGWRELLIILLVVLLVFGAKKLRTIGSDLGAAVRGFKKSMGDGENEDAKQIRSEGADAEFPESSKTQPGDQKTDRKV